ncbi:unnamed protein product [Phytophthora fragariaefolia]|uniref:Unnamed protein product n=1 Tax=Phytophthora fragariaefolia TaxID=1490495 RepID=A0A9W6TUR7_9STRA|nr:unnamed protein product [Phytophthora fragariaefolia]
MGLSVDFTYIKPGKRKKDIRGEDFRGGGRAHEVPRQDRYRFRAVTYLVSDTFWFYVDSPISRRNLGPDFEGVSDSSGASNVEIESEDADETNVEYLDLDEDDETKEDSRNDGQAAEGWCIVYIVDDTDMNLPVPPDMKFDRTLLAAIGGLENITRASVSDALLKNFGETGWSNLMTLTPYD